MDPYLRPEGTQLRQGAPEAPAARSREVNPLEFLLAVMGDPRNSWMGGPGKIVHGAAELPALIGALGPLFKSGRGWEVLHEYMRKGGTPEGLRKLLRGRGYDEAAVSKVGKNVRMGTDLAAPPETGMVASNVPGQNARAEQLRERYPEAVLKARGLLGGQQRQVLDSAAQRLQHEEPYLEPNLFYTTAAEKSAGRAQRAEAGRAHLEDTEHVLPSGVAGQGSYNTIASRMGRLMDDPNFLSLREHYLPPPVSDAAYYRELPINNSAYSDFHRSVGDSVLRHQEAMRSPQALASEALERQLGRRPTIRELQEHWEGLSRLSPDFETIPDLALEQMSRQQRGLAPPRSSLERMRTSDLNRRADVGEEGQH